MIILIYVPVVILSWILANFGSNKALQEHKYNTLKNPFKNFDPYMMYTLFISALSLWTFWYIIDEPLWIAAFHAVVLTSLFVTDARDTMLPDIITIPAFLIQIVIEYFIYPELFTINLIMTLIVTGCVMLLWLIMKKFKVPFGFGDVKVMLFLTMWQGIFMIFTIAFASIIGLFSSLLFRKKSTPFGPFLVIGSIISLSSAKWIVSSIVNMMIN